MRRGSMKIEECSPWPTCNLLLYMGFLRDNSGASTEMPLKGIVIRHKYRHGQVHGVEAEVGFPRNSGHVPKVWCVALGMAGCALTIAGTCPKSSGLGKSAGYASN